MVSPLRWLGVCLIVLGAGVITYTEKVKPKAAPAGAASSPAAGLPGSPER